MLEIYVIFLIICPYEFFNIYHTIFSLKKN